MPAAHVNKLLTPYVLCVEDDMRSFPIKTESIQLRVQEKAVFLPPMAMLLWNLVSLLIP